MRAFIAKELSINSWSDVKIYFEELHSREITTFIEFKKWLSDKSELDAVLEEDCAWRYIKMTIDTTNEDFSKAYNTFITEIQPELAPWEDKLNEKLIQHSTLMTNIDTAHIIYFRSVKTNLALFREENIALEAKVNEESQKYGAISAAQSIIYNNETLTMQRASNFLKEQDSTIRKEVFELMATRRNEDREKLDLLFNELIQLRHQIALNAGFQNYRDYKFVALGRFDYTKEDCFAFHSAVKNNIVPFVKLQQEKHKAKLGVDVLKPWDTEVDPDGLAPLKPFETGEDLMKGCIEMFHKIDPYFADCLRTMQNMKHIDLDSKPGKAPGGYNYPLYESNVPFIFMNAVGSQRDLVTMVHEGGHAVHSFLSADLELTGFKSLPSEVAELASMSMEMLSMPYWDQFYSNQTDLNRAKREQIIGTIKILPWIAQIDEFQHWIYSNPSHSTEQRTEQWLKLNKEYGSGITDWSGYEDVTATSWQRQLHLFEVPFYYIEYGIAQLGSLGVWKNSLENKDKAIDNYKAALKFGYTNELKELYKTAGVTFDFSEKNISDLMEVVKREVAKIETVS
jgi:oligoendopeptidase F